jgi:xanthine dehydrogenase YagS FAD-binding subunit
MKAFTYRSPATVEEAAKLLGANALALAGGTSLLNLMKGRVLEPDVLVNLKGIKGLDKVEAGADGIRIGANVTLTALLEDAAIRAKYPALAQALELVATPQIRNMATIGGNLCAKPPCWYYSNEGFPCPKRGSSEPCPAKDKEGQNEYHAIFATDGLCVAVHASSLAPALVVLGARVEIGGAKGAREVPLQEFFALPEGDVKRENVLAPNEILTHVILGKGSPKSATFAVLHKASHDWPVGLAAAALEMEGDTCKSARICLGAVAPIPWRAREAEKALAGKKVTEETASKAADAAVTGAAPLSQNGYKVQTTRAAVKRAILVAATGKWR